MKAVPEFQGALLLWRTAALGKKNDFQINFQSRKVFCSAMAMLRVHLFCILAGFTCSKVRATHEFTFLFSTIPKQKPVGGVALVLPWYLRAGRVTEQP